MQITQSELMSIFYDDSIAITHIYLVFYNSSREQYVIIIIDESHYNFLQLLWCHLTRADDHTTIWNMFLQEEFRSSNLDIRLQTKYTCPLRLISEVDCITASRLKVINSVWIG